MATKVQGPFSAASSDGSSVSYTLTGVTSGDQLLIAIMQSNASLTPTLTITGNPAVTTLVNAGGNSLTGKMFVYLVKSAPSGSVTVSASGVTNPSLIVVELSGATNVDGVVRTGADTTAVTSDSMTYGSVPGDSDYQIVLIGDINPGAVTYSVGSSTPTITKQVSVAETSTTDNFCSFDCINQTYGGSAPTCSINKNVSTKSTWAMIVLKGAIANLAPASDKISPIADSVSTFYQGLRTPSDVIGLTDTAQTFSQYLRPAADVCAQVADTATRFAAHFRTATDAFGLSDTTSRSGVFARTASDTAVLADAVATFKTKLRTAADTLVVTDSAARSGTFGRLILDTIVITDQAIRQAVMARTASDGPSTITLGTAATMPFSLPSMLGQASGGTQVVGGVSDSAVAVRSKLAVALDTLFVSDAAIWRISNWNIVVGDFIPTLDGPFSLLSSASDIAPVVADSVKTVITRMRVVTEQLPSFGEGTIIHGIYQRFVGRFAR